MALRPVSGRFDNDRSGYRLATSVNGAVTGEGGDGVVSDDPHNVPEAESAAELPARVDEQMQSWDCAFKDLETSHFVFGQAWDRLDCPSTVKAVRDLSAQWPSTLPKLIEDKANGPAVFQMPQHEIAGIIPVTPEDGKMARAATVR